MRPSVAAARHGSNCPLEGPACLHGEYGVHSLFAGVPVQLGAQGIERTAARLRAEALKAA
jgi:malate/lactate dehydrogenase